MARQSIIIQAKADSEQISIQRLSDLRIGAVNKKEKSMGSEDKVILFEDDFSAFPIGPFPYDPEHSAMGEYHYFPAKGFSGQWYDPIVAANYRGPSWLVTNIDGVKHMEQQRVRNPLTDEACPMLVAGDVRWTDYTLYAVMRPLYTGEPLGVLFRYQTSLKHYAFTIGGGQAALWKVCKLERTLLAECEFAISCDEAYTLEVQCVGDQLICSVDGKELLRTRDQTYQSGKIAITGYMPAAFSTVRVETDEASYKDYAETKRADTARIAEKRSKYAQPKLHKRIDLKDFGAARQVRFGHLTGGSDWYAVFAQHQRRVYKDRYVGISCLTAVNLQTGDVLWQWGEPAPYLEGQHATCDLPFQVCDINGDGVDEVILVRDFKLMILSGHDGSVLKQIHTPKNEEPAEHLMGIEFKKHAHDRVDVDAIRIVNVSGNARPTDILIKDRYARLWVYDKDLNPLWKLNLGNTGHFPFSWDADGDGKEEIFCGYSMINSDGTVRWTLPIETDHTDEIIVGQFDPDGEEQIAIVSGWEGLLILDKDGTIRVRDISGHGQRISAANYCPERRGLEICATTYWGNQGIIYLYDGKGHLLWNMEPGSNGNIIAPVNWQGDGTELILLNGNITHGGMLDGDGDRVVVFPDDGHPDLCAEVINLTGDERDEIVLWDQYSMYIYTQDRPCKQQGLVYCPEKYPHYNCSNYRGEYAYARWKKAEGGNKHDA